jgi:hypothetical protein
MRSFCLERSGHFEVCVNGDAISAAPSEIAYGFLAALYIPLARCGVQVWVFEVAVSVVLGRSRHVIHTKLQQRGR